MKIFAEITARFHFIFVVRPPVLFDLTRIEGQVSPDAREGTFVAYHVLNGRMELFALAKSRKLKAFAKAEVQDAAPLPCLVEDERQALAIAPDLHADSDELKHQLLQLA